MLFLNCGQCAISTVFEGMELKVPAGGTVEIPDAIAWAVEPRGLPLKPCDQEPMAPTETAPDPEPVKRSPGRPRKAAQ